MKFYYKGSIILAAILMSACTVDLPKIQNNKKVSLTYQIGETWSEQIKSTAEKSYLYAQMASNSYKEKQLYFSFPDNVELLSLDSQDNDETGLAFNVYRVTHPEYNEIVIAFRGTEDATDWTKANVLGKQLKPALEKFEALKIKYSDHRFSVVGDSLGGSLATQISLCHPVNMAVFLNTSPRFSSNNCDTPVITGPNNRYSITEYGEAAKGIRLFGREATQLYTSINCRGGNTFEQHNAFDLALCLTKIAAENSDDARRSSEDTEAQISTLKNEELKQ